VVEEVGVRGLGANDDDVWIQRILLGEMADRSLVRLRLLLEL
jgi:hypothetical protein